MLIMKMLETYMRKQLCTVLYIRTPLLINGMHWNSRVSIYEQLHKQDEQTMRKNKSFRHLQLKHPSNKRYYCLKVI